MDVVIIFLYVFLIIIGAISIIISLVSLSNRISESDSSVETKWFKWKAPVRLVFGLLCIVSVIAMNKFDFYSIDKAKLAEYEKTIEEISRENTFLKEKFNTKDSIQTYYLLSIENNTAVSILKGQVLISNKFRELTIRGAETQGENHLKISEGKINAETGEKYFIKFHNELWGLNIFNSDISSKTVKIEVYKDSDSLIINN